MARSSRRFPLGKSLELGAILLSQIILIAEGNEFPPLDAIRSQVSPQDQAVAVQGLIQRLIPSRATEFQVSVDPSIGPANKDTFKLTSQNGDVLVTGTSGVAAAWGLQHYLKYYCGCHVSWGGDQLGTIPSPLPQLPAGGITVTSNDRFRYYQNVCTVSYSFVWWNWTRWEREIDWMALNGINLPLAFTGQEAIFQKVYMKMGFSADDLNQFFTGPAFLAWGRMGNIEAFGGPLSQNWIKEQLALQHQILTRMRLFGMTPVLPGFAGHVPPATTRLFPNASVSRLGSWARFNATYSMTYLLDFDDPLFNTIGTAFIYEMIGEFGTDHVYNADTFNEMTPKSSDPKYLASAGRSVYAAMATADPEAVWVMQGWMFLSGFWQPPQAEALLTSVSPGKMLILDLMSELSPQYTRLKSYYGQPFIWCMLHNFGGNDELYGVMGKLNTEPFEGRNFPNSTMVGIGLAPEGINQNDVIYEFMNENAWRTQPRNITQWVVDYSMRRYGGRNSDAERAWTLLAKSVYNYPSEIRFHGKVGVVRRPSLKLKRFIWYTPAVLRDAWAGLVKASSQFSSSLFRYDLVDVTRECLQLVCIKFYTDFVAAYKQKNIPTLKDSVTRFLDAVTDLDLILASDPHFLLGRWLEDAKAWARNADEKILYEYNARNQITLWGPAGEIRDYAAKEWAGLMKTFYLKRWAMFLEEVIQSAETGQIFNQSLYDKKVFTLVEQPFTFARDLYPTQTQGDSIDLARKLYQKYGSILNAEFSRKVTVESDKMVTKFRSRNQDSNFVFTMHQKIIP
ncbi:alpha-N-acetylglucosaminidase-like [Liolophura sinensis]|uniref:alpha-N-acetylglucosaminidase-like n=1 Tax=Liolophura sinensis TaxID=3198878 RepID=UPI003158F97C